MMEIIGPILFFGPLYLPYLALCFGAAYQIWKALSEHG